MMITGAQGKAEAGVAGIVYNLAKELTDMGHVVKAMFSDDLLPRQKWPNRFRTIELARSAARYVNQHRVEFDVGELNVAAHYHRRVVIGSVGGNGELRVRDRCHGEYSCSYGCQYRRRTSTNNRNESAGSRRPSLVACAYSVFSLTTRSWARRIVASGRRPASHVRQVVPHHSIATARTGAATNRSFA